MHSQPLGPFLFLHLLWLFTTFTELNQVTDLAVDLVYKGV